MASRPMPSAIPTSPRRGRQRFVNPLGVPARAPGYEQPPDSPRAGAGYSTAGQPIRGFELRKLVSPLLAILPAPGSRQFLTATRRAAIDEGPPPQVVTRFFRPAMAGSADPTGGTGFPGGAMLHVPHYLSITRPSGKAVSPGPKTVDNGWNTISVFVGGQQ